MHNLQTRRSVGSTLAAVLLGIAMPGRAAMETEPLRVFVSIPPQRYTVSRLGGERVVVDVLVGPGQNPHTYEPTGRQMAALSEAAAFFRIGASFETTLIPKLEAMPGNRRIVDVRAGIVLRDMTEDCTHNAPCDSHAHAHGSPDPHIWTSPLLVATQAATVCEALIELDPQGADLYRRNLREFRAELFDLHARLARALAPIRGKTFLVFHPAWGYFADEFGLRMRSVESEGKTPPAAVLARLIDGARAEGVRVVFAQPQLDPRMARTIADAIGGVVIPIDPLAEDWAKNLEDVAEKIRKGLSSNGGEADGGTR